MSQKERNFQRKTDNVLGGSSKTRKTSTGDTTIKSNPGTLQKIIISANGTTNTLTVKDGATTLISVVLTASVLPHVIFFGIDMATSIVVGMSAADGDILVIYD